MSRIKREVAISLRLLIFGKKALRAHRKHEKEDKVSGERLPTEIDLSTESLRYTENYAASESAPDAAEAAKYNAFYSGKEIVRTATGIEIVS